MRGIYARNALWPAEGGHHGTHHGYAAASSHGASSNVSERSVKLRGAEAHDYEPLPAKSVPLTSNGWYWLRALCCNLDQRHTPCSLMSGPVQSRKTDRQTQAGEK